MNDLTQALLEISKNTSPRSTHPIYVGSETADIFWDIICGDKFITIYGVKSIGRDGDLFVYEGVLFDNFPDNYQLLYISYRNRFDCERAEEVEIVELTDTKIVFKCAIAFPKDKNNIILQWN